MRRSATCGKTSWNASGRRRRVFVLAACCLVILGAGWVRVSTGADPGDLGRFLVMADIHFDPFHDAQLTDRLAAAEPHQWPAILESAPPGFSTYGTDTNYRLLRSALADARAREPSPDFILYQGDFLAHRWPARFHESAKDRSEGAYRAFTDKTVRFVAREFARYFPGVPVFPALGNEDSYCGDYEIQPGGAFLRAFARAWQPLLGPAPRGETDFAGVFPGGGYFSTRLPRVEKYRLIVLNTVFFSSNYTNACGDPGQEPGRDQLEWLRATLERTRVEGERAWLLMHIPLGIDVFDTLKQKAGSAPVAFWHPAFAGPFMELMRRYESTVQALFSGHIHMDTFRVLPGPDGRAVLFNHIAPAVSPVFGNNPGYQLFSYARSTGALADVATFYLADLSRAGPEGAGQWLREYAFNDAYGLRGVNRVTLRALSRKVASEPRIRAKYVRYYNVSHTRAAAISNDNVKWYQCALEHPTPEGFEHCRKGN